MRRSAATIVELVTVVAILGLLTALLLPALQNARETARLAQCRNNLKQLSIAFQLHHGFHRTLPPSRIAKQHPTWAYLILPHLELNNLLWDGATRQSMYEMPLDLRTFVVAQYICPSRERDSPVVTLKADKVHFFPDRLEYAGSVSDYGGCRGARVEGESYAGLGVLRENGAVVHGVYDQFPENSQRITGWQGRIGHAMIEDGASRTLMLGELSFRRANRSHAFNGDQPPAEWLGIKDPFVLNRDENGFGSDHPATILFALCDGGVRGLHHDISPIVCNALATRAGGEHVAD